MVRRAKSVTHPLVENGGDDDGNSMEATPSSAATAPLSVDAAGDGATGCADGASAAHAATINATVTIDRPRTVNRLLIRFFSCELQCLTNEVYSW
jgi:hypothetical protein